MLTKWSLLALMSLVVWLVAPSAEAAAKLQQYHAIVIAHDNLTVRYDEAGSPYYAQPVEGSDKGIAVGWEPFPADPKGGSPLSFTVRDALRVERFMVKHGLPDRVTTLLPPEVDSGSNPYGTHREGNDLADVELAFEQTAARVAAARAEAGRRVEQVVFVHYSGHGTHLGLLLRDDLLSPLRFREWIEDLDGDLVVVVLDSCYGGGWGLDGEQVEVHEIESARDIPRIIKGQQGVAVFRAINRTPESEVLRTGVLTHVMLSGLMGGADENRDARLTFAELSDYFYLNTDRSGQFDGRPEAPGGNQHRVLFDLRHGAGVTPLSFSSELQGRVLVADDEGVLAEVNAAEGRFWRGRDTTIRLPVASPPDPLRIYHLPLDPDGAPLPPVSLNPAWNPAVHGTSIAAIQGTNARDPLAQYMVKSQEHDGLYAHHKLPAGSRKLGRQFSLGLHAGYHHTPAFGRLEDGGQLFTDYDDVGDATSEGQEEIYRLVMEQEPRVWNMAVIGTTARLHPITPLHLELRGDFEVTPRTDVSGDTGALLLFRGLGGGGFSGHLGSRSVLGLVSGGVGTMLIDGRELQSDAVADAPNTAGGYEPGLPVRDSSPFTAYGGLGFVLLRPGWNLDLEVLAFADRVTIVTLDSGPAGEKRWYPSIALSLGMDVGRWSF